MGLSPKSRALTSEDQYPNCTCIPLQPQLRGDSLVLLNLFDHVEKLFIYSSVKGKTQVAVTFMNVSHKNAQINEFSAFSSQYFCTAGFFKLKLEDSRYFHVFAIINGNILRVITLSF